MVSAGPLATDTFPRFWAEAASRLGPDGRPRLEVLVEFCHDGLHFERAGASFLSRLELSLIAYDEDGRQVGGDSWRRDVRVPGYTATLSDTDCYQESLFLQLVPGHYTAAVAVLDRHTGERSRLLFPVRVGGETGSRWHLSDLRFLTLSAEADSSSGFQRLEGRPDARREYDDETTEMMAEVELYTAAGEEPFPPADLRVDYSIEDAEGNELIRGEGELVGSHPGEAGEPAWVRYLVRESLTDLSRGDYSLQVSCRGGGMGPGGLIRRESFRILSSEAFWKEDFLGMVELLRYIATGSELRELREAPTEERRQRWETFWRKHDPNPSTPRNEAEEAYFRRIAYANSHFGTFHREGWETDRGMIYIRLGPPDDMDSYPGAAAGRMVEVWYYYSVNRRFYFIDETGFGDYRLQGEAGP